MKVFISWSGELSKQVALILGSWIEDVLQGTEKWISVDDIEKGAFWFSDISNKLSETSVGILCMTTENLSAPWILFEAGALSKGLAKNRVCPLLVNLTHTDLTSPLSNFNGTLVNKDDMLKLIKSINVQNGDKSLPEDKVVKAFDKWWDEFHTKFSKVLSDYKPAKKAEQRSATEIVAEVLEIVRAVQKTAQQSFGLQLSVQQKLDMQEKQSLVSYLSPRVAWFPRQDSGVYGGVVRPVADYVEMPHEPALTPEYRATIKTYMSEVHSGGSKQPEDIISAVLRKFAISAVVARELFAEWGSENSGPKK